MAYNLIQAHTNTDFILHTHVVLGNLARVANTQQAKIIWSGETFSVKFSRLHTASAYSLSILHHHDRMQ